MGSLQERRDAQTREEISTAAIGLFGELGFVETTMDDVATAAGVSRRTVYRHFANKEDLLFEVTRRWMEVLNRVVATRAQGETTRELCRRGVLAVAEHIESDRDAALAGYRIVADTPSLSSRHAGENRRWLDRYTGLIMADIDDHDAEALLHASVVAGALVGGTDGAVRLWAMFPGSSLRDMTAAVLERVDPLWP